MPRCRAEAKGDFLVDMMGPWYASYFATWLEYAAEAPERVLVLDYDEFPRRSRRRRWKSCWPIPACRARARACQAALDAVWEEREQFPLQQGRIAGAGARASRAARSRGWSASSIFIPNLAALTRQAYSAAFSFFDARAFSSGLRYWPV